MTIKNRLQKVEGHKAKHQRPRVKIIFVDSNGMPSPSSTADVVIDLTGAGEGRGIDSL